MPIFSTARKFKAMVTGADATTATSDDVISDLKAAAVPISLADCRVCPDPCDEGTRCLHHTVDLSLDNICRTRGF